MTTAAVWVLALIAILTILLLRATVRLLARSADNGWDNAIAYSIVSAALVTLLGWIAGSGGLLFLLVAPLLCWAAQTYALHFIYEVRLLHAWMIGVTHAFLVTVVVSSLTLAAAVVAAYILYGRIISDPMFLIRLILRLIGIELPI